MSTNTSRLTLSEAAVSRLERAVARLEKCLSDRIIPGTAPREAPAKNPDMFRASPQSQDLFGADELARAHQDYAKLESASRTVEQRIDQVVDRLQTLMEPEAR